MTTGYVLRFLRDRATAGRVVDAPRRVMASRGLVDIFA